MMTALYILGYIAVGVLNLWVMVRLGFIPKGAVPPPAMLVVVAYWPPAAMVWIFVGIVIKIGERLDKIADLAFSAREQAEKKEEQLLKLQEEKEKELREAIRRLDRELDEVEEKRKAQRFWSPARVNVLESVDHA